MTSFEDRIAKLDQKSQELKAASSDAGAGNSGGEMSEAEAFRALFLLPVGALLGALAVLIGGIVKVAILDGGFSAASAIPPQLGPVAIGIAIVMSFLADRIVGSGHAGKAAVTVGFLAMMYGEGYLARSYPQTWIFLYQADYLSFFTGETAGSEIALAPTDPVAPATGAAAQTDTK